MNPTCLTSAPRRASAAVTTPAQSSSFRCPTYRSSGACITIRLAAALAVGLSAGGLFAEEPRELQIARADYEKTLSHPSEAARSRYVTTLARMRERFARTGKASDWQAVDAEILQHPAPKDSDSKALSKTLIGKWESPRHEHVFRKDGTWSMLPVEPGIAHGRWRIEGNQYFDTAEADPRETSQYTIILLNATDFIFTDGKSVFYEKRISK